MICDNCGELLYRMDDDSFYCPFCGCTYKSMEQWEYRMWNDENEERKSGGG